MSTRLSFVIVAGGSLLLLTSCGGLWPAAERVEEIGTGIVEVLPQIPSAMAGNPAAIINVALGVLGSLGLVWGGKKVVDKVKASPPGKLTGPAD